MLRMGRSNKVEPEKPEMNSQPQSAPPPAAAAQPAHMPPRPAEPVQPPPPSEPARATESAATQSAPRAVSETESLARDIKSGVVGGFVGASSVLTGEANFRGMLRVDGRLAGRVNSADGTLIVSSGGKVDADVDVVVAKINGTVNGDIRASERIELGRTARVNGNIFAPALIIEQGAIFEGSCRMLAPAGAEAQDRKQRREPAAQKQPPTASRVVQAVAS